MTNHTPIKKYEFEGALAKICEGFIAEKRAVGYRYNTEAKKLSEFSRFSSSFDIPADTLPEEVVQAWIAKKPMDSDRNRYARLALIKLFAEYMLRLGYTAYCPTKDELGKIQWSYMPYIFTCDEISRFFAAIDGLSYKPYSVSPRRHTVMPLRMLYCCGLRVSEATNLHVKDVSLTDGVLTICESKFGKTRYVPMSDELLQVCRVYAIDNAVNPQDYFFRAPDGGLYDTRSIYAVFRDTLWKAGISHGGRGKGPRVHDFRHTFAVHCLEKWLRDGKELTSALPRLSAYLGHNDLTGTERYLRMTSALYPEITALLDQKYGYIIPKDGGVA